MYFTQKLPYRKWVKVTQKWYGRKWVKSLVGVICGFGVFIGFTGGVRVWWD
jgi:hypothetical protein